MNPANPMRWLAALWVGCFIFEAQILVAAPMFGPCSAASFVPVPDADWNKRFRRALRNGDEEVLRPLLNELTSPDEDAVKLILEAMALIPSESVYEKAREVLKAHGSEALDAPFQSLIEARKSPPILLAALLSVAASFDDATSESWILAALTHSNELVLRNAIETAQKRRSKEAIPKLIDLLDEKGLGRGVISYNAHRALISLTGHDFAVVEDWRNFWESSKASLDPKKLGDEEGMTGVSLKEVDSPQFFGVEIISRRVAFVIDISGSMTMWDPGSEEGGSGSSWENRQRIRRTKFELVGAIRKLAGGARFNVISFNHVVQSFVKALVPANEKSKSRAAKWVNRLRADNATHTDEALETAFADPNVDTIILLSDGAPMKAGNREHVELGEKILRRVRDLNRLKKVRIFTFGFEGEGRWPPGSKYRRNAPRQDPKAMIEFLKELAEKNGGTYTPIR